jgi:rhodanese-related sulfurtransferase
MSRRRYRKTHDRRGLRAVLRRPAVQIVIVLAIAAIIYLIALGGGASSGLTSEISVEEAYQLYQQGSFVLDVRTQQEWDEYHAPNTTLIPLDQLQSRLGELPKDKQIVVVCRSGNRSQEGRNILLSAGFQASSMAGGLSEWKAKGYPVESAP